MIIKRWVPVTEIVGLGNNVKVSWSAPAEDLTELLVEFRGAAATMDERVAVCALVDKEQSIWVIEDEHLSLLNDLANCALVAGNKEVYERALVMIQEMHSLLKTRKLFNDLKKLRGLAGDGENVD